MQILLAGVLFAPALQADSSSIGALVTSNAIQNLPLNGRNFIRLAQLVPGANESVQNAMSSGNRPDDRRRTSSLSVNGMHDYANNFMIDGMDNNERAIATMVLRPSMDALAEFRVQTNLCSAELGRTARGVVNPIHPRQNWRNHSSPIFKHPFETFLDQALTGVRVGS